MSKRVDGSLGTLLQGVSQQPAKERLSGQVAEQINMTADVVKMLSRRAPAQYLNQLTLGTVDITKVFTHFYSRGDGEQYFIMVAPGGILKIFALDGTELTPEVSAQFTSYITTTDPRADLRMATVGDYSFIVNNTVVPTMDAALTSDAGLINQAGRVTVKTGVYSRDYTIHTTIDGVDYSVTHSTPASDAGTPTQTEPKIATDYIANELLILLVADVNISAAFDLYNQGAHLALVPKLGTTDYSITTADGSGDGALTAIDHNEVSALTNLPSRAKADEVYAVNGGSGAADDLWMIFEVNDEAAGDGKWFQEGLWVETVKPGIPYLFDATTMPHVIIRNELSVFVCGAAGETVNATTLDAWANRLVGDEESNKEPQFIGSRIVDVTSFQDRLVILDEEGVNFSVTRDFFNLWKKTVATLLADGPIGITSASGQVNILRFAVQHDKDLIVFADKVQFTVFGTAAITPQAATMSETTKFKIQSDTHPVPSGQNLFFAINQGAYGGVREFYTDSTFDSNNARPITVAIERYIKGRIRNMSSATNLNKLAVLADSLNTVYLYEYLWDEGERAQTAWSSWVFRDDMSIFHTEFFEDSLYILGYIGTDIHILDIPIQRDTEEDDLLVNETLLGGVHLDHRTVEVVPVDTVTGLTHLPADIELLDAIQGEGCPNPGLRASIKSWDGNTLVFKRDMLGGDVFIGMKYRSSITPTQPFVRDRDGRPILTSKLIIGKMFINYGDSGDFNVDVTAGYSYTERNPGRVLGSQSSVIGEYSLMDGTFPVPVREQNNKSSITIWSESPYPFTIQDIEWDGKYHKRGTRMSTGG